VWAATFTRMVANFGRSCDRVQRIWKYSKLSPRLAILAGGSGAQPRKPLRDLVAAKIVARIEMAPERGLRIGRYVRRGVSGPGFPLLRQRRVRAVRGIDLEAEAVAFLGDAPMAPRASRQLARSG
jgi:hypothetical protein